MQRYLAERLSFDQLFRMSEPKRVIRSFKVKGPPLEIDSYQDAVYYAFNFKSFPSTTGLRHRGYIKFLRPRIGGQKPLQHLNCIVDCTCPDFRYRWAWANKQRGASRVGDQSLNQALNRAPRKTNPTSRPGLCKHILAAREYIYGLLSSFPNDTPDTADKLDKLTQFATRRWANMPAEMDAARARQRAIAAARNQRNAGQPAPQDLVEPEPEDIEMEPHEPGDEEAYARVVPPEIRDAPELQRVPEPPRSFAAGIRPPSQRGRMLPSTSQAAPPKPKEDRIQKGSKAAELAKRAGYNSAAAYNFARRQGLGDSLGYSTAKNETNDVVMTNGKNMNALTEAQRIISELEQDELASLRAAGQEDQGAPESLPPAGDMGGGDNFDAQGGGDLPPGDDMGADLPPSEPPVSDSAVGADSEGQVALQLLGEIRDFLGQLASALAPAPEPEEGEMGEGGAGPIGGEPEDGEEIPVEDPSAEAEAEAGEGEGESEPPGEEEEEEERAEEEDKELAKD
jgi:hypothetical protein